MEAVCVYLTFTTGPLVCVESHVLFTLNFILFFFSFVEQRTSCVDCNNSKKEKEMVPCRKESTILILTSRFHIKIVLFLELYIY
uniref:Uncharacterized protein n=1 Tax=Solanum lycopersicum TaxID=4081 RepID=A0A3Q7G6E2_SOLLC